jgi:membrane protease subunit (stomatin/prohibitin family)
VREGGFEMAIEILQSLDNSGKVLAERVPRDGEGDVAYGAQLIVRESQEAVFYRDGQALDSFAPGRHTLTTANIPLLRGLLKLPFGGKTPFKAECYFVNKKVFTDLKWGTPQPVAFRDSEFGIIRLRAHGMYALKVTNSSLFVNKYVGTAVVKLVDELEDFLRGFIVSKSFDFLGEQHKTLLDLPQHYNELAIALRAKLNEEVASYGIEFVDFTVGAITAPPEVEKAMDERAKMGAIGDMGQYTRYKTAQAIGDAAKQSGGGMAGMGAGIGAGMAIGNQMADSMSGGKGSADEKVRKVILCPKCGNENEADNKFCGECGVSLRRSCPKCGEEIPPGDKFCGNCGEKLG